MVDKPTCLIVDDSRVIREITIRIISDLDLNAVGVESAQAGLEHCRVNRVHAVMLDWDLPDMGALDFLRGAADFAPDAKPQIILCATENDQQQFSLARAAGAAHHILKPYDRSAVESKLYEIGLLQDAAIAASK
ncbi:MAG: response regulator [Pseudomonadota bacterium]